ncbi:hypothetical protein FRC14_007889 [Serendipita sp. 396]|nr:hypothetical protein FRC14_007889 [Serendipita sp. 396]KAG8784971.1 hypothetical protein FRC15_002266 [Serendipita sp. 397]
MNSYPIELLVQHAPLMFVAGLDVPPAERDPFRPLILRLREVLTSRPKGLIWDMNRASAFNILLVDKNVRFPPRKVISPSEQNAMNPHPHSPLSPLIPTSPLHPDGLIAPVWVRKHVELVPSVYVLFLKLWESPPPLSPLEGREQEMEEERKHDQELATELSQRKRTLAERGIKLTAVLLASRRLLDDPGLDVRLTFIRKQSSLDARAALFVLSPVSSNELQEFVKSLTEALREPSIEYYTAHSKRVRRKRNKHSSSAYSGYQTSAVATTRASPLRPIGWTARYEYKLATFAEFRVEEEVARKHYEDCWNILSEMFNSTTLLPPRTKRWAEARVLADSLNIKVYKFYLYNSEHPLALAFFNKHIRRYCELSKGWGMGEETFEYWSWLARQYRILSELLEIALRSGMRLPELVPQIQDDRPVPQLGQEASPAPGVNPSTVLQHPGYYYLQAARCTEERLRRFKTIEEAEAAHPSPLSQSPAFNNEKKVDHWELILELYSKAYEHFKRFAAGHTRLTFFVAVHIATTYHSSGKHDLAIKFLERIVKVYHKEQWGLVLKPLLGLWYESSKQLGDIQSCIRLIFERMFASNAAESEILAQDLLEILKTTKPSSASEPLVITLSPVENIVPATVLFYESQAGIGVSTPFQLHIATSTSSCLHLIPFSSLTIHFSDNRSPTIINRSISEGKQQTIRLGDLGDDENACQSVDCAFDFIPGATTIFYGQVSSSSAKDITITRLTLRVQQNDWTIDINCDVNPLPNAEPMWLVSPEPNTKFIPLRRTDTSIVQFRPAPHEFKVDIRHQGKALVGEEYPIDIIITSQDSRILDITFDLLLQPAEDDTVHYISTNEERTTSLLRGITFNDSLEPLGATQRTIFLNAGGTGSRILDFSFQSRTRSPASQGYSDEAKEHLETLVIDVVEPIRYSSQVTYSPSRLGLPSSFSYFSQLGEQAQTILEANVTLMIECTAECKLEVAEMKWTSMGSSRTTLLDSSLSPDSAGDLIEWRSGDAFAVDASIGIKPSEEPNDKPVETRLQSPVRLDVLWRRADNTHPNIPLATTAILLPELYPPQLGLSVIVNPPATAKLHSPFTLSIKIRNSDPLLSADLSFSLEPTDAFVIAGMRAGRLPLILPDTEEALSFNLIPTIVGVVKLPLFKVQRVEVEDSSRSETVEQTRSSSSTEIVPTIDERWNAVDRLGRNVHFYTSDGQARAEIDLSLWLAILVLA